ncbi:MAG: DUF4931 domain-containing protein [Candidatus Woesearchaeota archaeon]
MNSEIRKDYFSKRYVIISKARRNRPMRLENVDLITKEEKNLSSCPFCKGNEHLSVEVFRDKDDWTVRVIENKFPILSNDNNIDVLNFTENVFPGKGEHYVIVETPEHFKRFHELSDENITTYLKILSSLTEKMYNNKDIEYVYIFKNEGIKSGASLFHSHSQAIGMPFVPPRIIEIVSSSFNHPGCYVEKIISEEKNSERFVEETEHFIIFCPYASITPYELYIIPKKHIPSLNFLVEKEIKELSKILKKYISKLYNLTDSYNIHFYQAPRGHDFHLIINIISRITTWGGVELGTGIIVNPTTPEEAAQYYRQN